MSIEIKKFHMQQENMKYEHHTSLKLNLQTSKKYLPKNFPCSET